MLVSHRKKFIYTKTFKTAGTSAEVYFEQYCLPEGTWQFTHAREAYAGETGIVGYRGSDAANQEWYNHMSAEMIQRKIGEDLWSTYFKFCAVRNPFAKLVSAFHFFEHTKNERAQPRDKAMLSERGKEMPRVLKERFRAWVRQGELVEDRDKYMINGKICLDYFIKQEDLANGIRHVCEVLDIPFQLERIPRLKSEIRPKQYKLSDYYDAETKAMVADRYEFEFSYFGYSNSP